MSNPASLRRTTCGRVYSRPLVLRDAATRVERRLARRCAGTLCAAGVDTRSPRNQDLGAAEGVPGNARLNFEINRLGNGNEWHIEKDRVYDRSARFGDGFS